MATGIFLDLDGTLLNDSSKVSDNTIQFLNSIDTTENKIFIVTGKRFDMVQKIIEDIETIRFIASSNGQIITDTHTNEILHRTLVSQNEVDALLIDPLIINSIKGFVIETTDFIYSMEDGDESLSKLFVTKDVKKRSYDNQAIFNILGTYIKLKVDSENEILKIKNQLIDAHSSIAITYWYHDKEAVLYVTSNKINKKNAVKMLMEICNITDVICFGDGYIDKGMLKEFTSYAMLNATQQIQQVANYVTEFSNNDDGVIKTLETILK